MKIRKGFVSNSSSSSFIVELDKISDDDLMCLENHIYVAKSLSESLKHKLAGYPPPFDTFFGSIDEHAWWGLRMISDNQLLCSTIMDNFDFQNFCSILGIPYIEEED